MVGLRPGQEAPERLGPQPQAGAGGGADPQLPGAHGSGRAGTGQQPARGRHGQPTRARTVGQGAADAGHPDQAAPAVAPGVPQAAAALPGGQLGADRPPGRGEARVVGAEGDAVAAAEGRVEGVAGRPVAAGEPDQGHLPALALQLEVAVHGGPDQPGHLVLLVDRLGEHDTALGRAQLPRRDELDGRQRSQVRRVDPDLTVGTGEGCLGRTPGGHPLATGPPHQARGRCRPGEGGGSGQQRRRQRAGARVDRDAGRRCRQGRGGHQTPAGGGEQDQVDGPAPPGPHGRDRSRLSSCSRSSRSAAWPPGRPGRRPTARRPARRRQRRRARPR